MNTNQTLISETNNILKKLEMDMKKSLTDMMRLEQKYIQQGVDKKYINYISKLKNQLAKNYQMVIGDAAQINP